MGGVKIRGRDIYYYLFPKRMRSCVLQFSPTHFLPDGLRLQFHRDMAEGRSSVACHTQFIVTAAAPIGNELLTPDDAIDVQEEIIEAQNQAYALGLKLKLLVHVVDAICEKHSQPRDRLLQVIIAFTKQVDPRPTWRAIVAALRSPAVNLPQLAMRVEAAHCRDLATSCDAPLPDTTTPTGTLPHDQDRYIMATKYFFIYVVILQ